MEIWKDIQGYKGLYQVSNLGLIKSLKKTVSHWRGGTSVLKEKTIKPYKLKTGYLIVQLYKNGNDKRFLVHRIVAKEFIPNPKNKEQVNHLNGVKTDNRLENLEWCSRSENIKHADENNLRVLKGTNNSQSKLTEEQVLKIRSIGKSKTLQEIADLYGVKFQCISKILNRKTWKHI